MSEWGDRGWSGSSCGDHAALGGVILPKELLLLQMWQMQEDMQNFTRTEGHHQLSCISHPGHGGGFQQTFKKGIQEISRQHRKGLENPLVADCAIKMEQIEDMMT